MSFVSADIIQDIKSRLDPAAIVQRYVELQPAGDRLTGVCPFHQETKPSFSLNPVSGLYYCFGCQASGDIIDFYCRINGLDFPQGLAELAGEAGVELGTQAGPDTAQIQNRKACFQMHELAQSFFAQGLQAAHGAQARTYLARRNLSEKTTELFGLGWSPNDWHGLEHYLQKHGFKPPLGVQAGLLSENKQGRIYDRFRSRITFPIRDLSGRVIAFGGRIIGEGEPKYLNSSDSPIFKKGDLLFGLYEARKTITQTKVAILTEGYADVLALFQHGFHNACGVLGTALTTQQTQRLSGLCREVQLIFDGDRAGLQASLRSTEMILGFGLKVRVVKLPEDEDVDSFLQTRGAQKLHDLIQNASEGLAFCLEMISNNYSPKQTMDWAGGFLKNLRNATWRAYYIPRLASGLGINESELREALHSSRPQHRKPSTSPTFEVKNSGEIQRERELLRFAILCPAYKEALVQEGLDHVLKTERGRQLWSKLLQYGHETILPHLDKGEKQFFIQCQMQESELSDPEIMWEEIRSFLLKRKKKAEQKRLQDALRKAQQSGDEREVGRLLQEYSTFIRGEQ